MFVSGGRDCVLTRAESVQPKDQERELRTDSPKGCWMSRDMIMAMIVTMVVIMMLTEEAKKAEQKLRPLLLGWIWSCVRGP